MDENWTAVTRRLKRPGSEAKAIREEFFAGDIIDRGLVNFIRSLRPQYKTGIISNAWPDLRDYVVEQKFDDAFDHMIISAEVGVIKPKAEIYQIALKQLEVRPSEAVFVDDFIQNIEGCEKVGMKGIHFKDPELTMQKLKALL